MCMQTARVQGRGSREAGRVVRLLRGMVRAVLVWQGAGKQGTGAHCAHREELGVDGLPSPCWTVEGRVGGMSGW